MTRFVGIAASMQRRWGAAARAAATPNKDYADEFIRSTHSVSRLADHRSNLHRRRDVDPCEGTGRTGVAPPRVEPDARRYADRQTMAVGGHLAGGTPACAAAGRR